MQKKDVKAIHEQIAYDHYDKGIKDNFLQRIWHQSRCKKVLSIPINEKDRVLDIGCHSGLFTEKIVTRFNIKQIYGLDISPRAISFAKKRIKGGKFLVGNAHKLPYKSNYFDVVYCLEMLEHVEDPDKVIREIKRVLKKNGHAIILIPTDNLLFRITWYLWNLYQPVWKDVHIQSFQSSSLIDKLKKANLEIEQVVYFNCRMLLMVQIRK
jgi:ubiquinone/menaquinone biosynthesis C-methylase UbiE